jgi:hypothetical protein
LQQRGADVVLGLEFLAGRVEATVGGEPGQQHGNHGHQHGKHAPRDEQPHHPAAWPRPPPTGGGPAETAAEAQTEGKAAGGQQRPPRIEQPKREPAGPAQGIDGHAGGVGEAMPAEPAGAKQDTKQGKASGQAPKRRGGGWPVADRVLSRPPVRCVRGVGGL